MTITLDKPTQQRLEALTPEEYKERLDLLSQMEHWQVARLEAVVELAQIREATPHAVMQKLGILPV